MSTKKGHAAVAMVARYGETKAHLEAALHHLHGAMAITPWLDLVESLGQISCDVAAELAKHAAAFEESINPSAPEAADDPTATG